MPVPPVSTPSRSVALVTPDGELDVATAPALRDALRRAAATGCSLVVVDLSGVTFVDSTVLGVLVEVHRALAPERGLRLVGATGLPLRALQLTGLDTVLDLRPPDEALARELAGRSSDA